MYITKREAGETSRDYAFRVLKNNIINLELEPGSMVSENELAAELGLSRGPVREAIMELAKVKIVEVYPQRGNFISKVDYDLIEEARFMRATLEIAVVERCCIDGMKDEHLSALKENVILQRFYLDGDDFDKLRKMDNEFHRILFLSANSIQIYTFMNSMLVHFDRVRAMTQAVSTENKSVEEHSRILDAVVQGDAEAAKLLMNSHLTRYQVDWDTIRAKYPQYLK